ncbi:MAG: hypothetical protein J5965_15945 [Aeriscardovia sp.]|nr:hypothetical protein [Aeriscardovia sp.]
MSNSRMFTIFTQIDGKKMVVTTDFNHCKKRYYEYGEAEHPNQVTLHVTGYKKNLSIKRIWSHLMFAHQLKKYLNSLSEKPSAIYCTMPTSSSAYVCAKYCKKHGIKFVIDVIDLWPDSLLPLVKGETVIKAMLYPWTYLTRYAYKSADVIMGESVKYANEAKKYNQKADVYPIYLGVDMQIINKVKTENQVLLEKPEDEVWIAYAGSLGVSYDFNALLEAVKSIHGRYKYKLWFVGDGVRHNEIETYIKSNGLNAEITGFLSYDQLLGYLSYCDIAVNIFRNNTKVVYSYKFNDYVAMDCFVLNSLEGETAQMVDEYSIGRNFNFSDQPLSTILGDTLKNWEDYCKWNVNCKRLIEEKLDKEKIYSVVKEIF